MQRSGRIAARIIDEKFRFRSRFSSPAFPYRLCLVSAVLLRGIATAVPNDDHTDAGASDDMWAVE
jgi:hypothetical protein